MPNKQRPFPEIPDHDVLRKIGGGAYGEVWLARTVTGALRAVKVVWREDFEDERGFEREFEGILKYEPISRDHPTLMNVLHVGRSKDLTTFYYYVMELGDDVSSGSEINPAEYVPRTLRADAPGTEGVQLPVNDCIEIGLRLAEALEHLHGLGLAHRDVKPSNVIFVQGKAKLADIGLVAMRGQRTFVGTEGFVPPEGPGSAQADVYSLGKVLYEIATGQDRMNFPELPEQMPGGPDRKRWLELNRIICEVCDPRISKRRITTATQLVESLGRIQRGKRRHRSSAPVWATALVLTVFSGWAGWQIIKDQQVIDRLVRTFGEPKPAIAMVRVFSSPDGADVYDETGVLIGTTPTETLTARVGETLSYTLRRKGYSDAEILAKVPLSAADEPMALSATLKIYSPPELDEPWTDSFGDLFLPVENHHESYGYVRHGVWQQFLREGNGKSDAKVAPFVQNGREIQAVLCKREDADLFAAWFREQSIAAGFLTEDFEVTALPDRSFKASGVPQNPVGTLFPFRLRVREIINGSLVISTEPEGGEIFVNGESRGIAFGSIRVRALRPGDLDLQVLLEGFKPYNRTLKLGEGEQLVHEAVLVPNQGVVFGKPWENGIGMRFAPVGTELMASIWETRVVDFRRFTDEAPHPKLPDPGFSQEDKHPVVNVSRKEAMAFCVWLTEHEVASERITPLHVYRLPTDAEWSAMAGITETPNTSPGWRDARKEPVFPWGADWPEDGARVGNFADASAAIEPGMSIDRTILGYDDGFPHTAPVGSFHKNPYGLYDLSGNVQEWVSDPYSKIESVHLGVLRGGGWNTHQVENLYTGSRNGAPPDYRDPQYGFRIVLAKIP